MPAVNVILSEQAHAGWTRLAAEQGVTVTALLEVLGLRLANGDPAVVDEQTIRDARLIAHERRRAGGPRKKG